MGSQEDQEVKELPPVYVPKNPVDISPKKDGGVLKEILVEGIGNEMPSIGSKSIVHYVGSLADGSVFDSSRDRKSPFEFNLGQGQVIKAWDIGVASMKKGEKAMLICKPEYAYGAAGSPPKIPPNSTLYFEVELLGWEGEDLSSNKDKGIVRYIITKGEGHNTPNDGTVVDIHLVGVHNGRIFEEKEVQFPIGEGCEYGICSGLEQALGHFKRGEKSRIELKSKYAFGAAGEPSLQIPPDADITYTIEMSNFERMKDGWDMDSAEKLEQAKLFKEKGTKYFKTEKYSVALRMYKKILDILNFDSGFDDQEATSRDELLLQGRLNIALCHLKLGENLLARDECNSVLEKYPTNEKGLFRRGQAYLNLAEPEIAKKDFESILQHEANNKAAANHVKLCNQMIKEQLSREKQIYANMFEKFAKIDRQKEEEERQKLPDVMKTLGEWGQDAREREMGDFERENPNILLLNSAGEFKNM